MKIFIRVHMRVVQDEQFNIAIAIAKRSVSEKKTHPNILDEYIYTCRRAQIASYSCCGRHNIIANKVEGRKKQTPSASKPAQNSFSIKSTEPCRMSCAACVRYNVSHIRIYTWLVVCTEDSLQSHFMTNIYNERHHAAGRHRRTYAVHNARESNDKFSVGIFRFFSGSIVSMCLSLYPTRHMLRRKWQRTTPHFPHLFMLHSYSSEVSKWPIECLLCSDVHGSE